MSSVQNGTYGFGTVLTADREALAEQPSNVEQPSKKASVLPPATSANEVMQFHFVDSWKQVRWPVRISKLCSFCSKKPAVVFTHDPSAAVQLGKVTVMLKHSIVLRGTRADC